VANAYGVNVICLVLVKKQIKVIMTLKSCLRMEKSIFKL